MVGVLHDKILKCISSHFKPFRIFYPVMKGVDQIKKIPDNFFKASLICGLQSLAAPCLGCRSSNASNASAKLCTTKHFYVASTQWNYFGWWKQEIFKFSTFHLMDHLQLCALCKCGALQSIQPPPTQKNKPDRSGRKWTKYCLKWRRQKQ